MVGLKSQALGYEYTGSWNGTSLPLLGVQFRAYSHTLTTYPSCHRLAIATIVRREGVRGLYRGIIPNLLKASPAQAVSFGSYELTKDLIDRFRAEDEEEDGYTE